MCPLSPRPALEVFEERWLVSDEDEEKPAGAKEGAGDGEHQPAIGCTEARPKKGMELKPPFISKCSPLGKMQALLRKWSSFLSGHLDSEVRQLS